METVRDLVIIVAGITTILTLSVLVVMGLRLYARASRTLVRVGRATDDIHGAVEGARSGMNAAKEMLEIAGFLLPGAGWVKLTSRGTPALFRAIRFITGMSRTKDKPADG